jgi:WD40 repeat protein
MIAAVGMEGIVGLWDRKTCTVRLPAGQALFPVRSLAFTSDGQTLITASRWPVRKQRGLVLGHTGDTSSQENVTTSLRFWDPASGTERPGLDGPLSMAPPELIALTPNGRYLAAGGVDGSIRLWDRQNSRQPCERLFVSPEARAYVLMFEKIRKSVNGGQPIYQESVRSVAFSPNGQMLATAGSAGQVKLWDGGDGWREVAGHQLDASAPVWAVFSPAGQLVLPRGGQVHFHAHGDQPGFPLGTEGDAPPVCVAFTACGDRVAVAHQDRRVRLWDLEKKTLLGELIGHLDQVSALAFSPGGKTLASASHDRTVKLWSVAAAGEVASLEQHRGKVFCLAFSPDGTTLASGGEELDGRGAVYLWRAPRP